MQSTRPRRNASSRAERDRRRRLGRDPCQKRTLGKRPRSGYCFSVFPGLTRDPAFFHHSLKKAAGPRIKSGETMGGGGIQADLKTIAMLGGSSFTDMGYTTPRPGTVLSRAASSWPPQCKRCVRDPHFETDRVLWALWAGQPRIQGAVDTVAKQYGRFLPQDKAALAAQILNRVWGAALCFMRPPRAEARALNRSRRL